MATVDEMLGYLNDHYALERADENVYTMQVLGADEGPAVFIAFWGNQTAGDFMHILSPIARVEALDLRHVLTIMDNQLVGGLVVWSGFVCVRHTLPIANAFDTDVDENLRLVAMAAASIQAEV